MYSPLPCKLQSG